MPRLGCIHYRETAPETVAKARDLAVDKLLVLEKIRVAADLPKDGIMFQLIARVYEDQVIGIEHEATEAKRTKYREAMRAWQEKHGLLGPAPQFGGVFGADSCEAPASYAGGHPPLGAYPGAYPGGGRNITLPPDMPKPEDFGLDPLDAHV